MKKFNEINKKFGFGLMRLPMIDKDVDIEQTKKMVDVFIEKGFTYFDTAHGYIDGKSELAFKECVVKRYERNKYTITNKLTHPYFNSEEEIIPFFNSQLEACGVDYFDFYLMHAQSRNNYEHFKKHHAYEIALKLKSMGKIRHFGISFHDSAEFLDKILTENPEIEVVQLQLNYVDYEDDRVQGRLCYEVCLKHNKPVIVMEPVKGGSLVNLPYGANKPLKELNAGSNASYAIRYAASFDNVVMVLSGMSTLAQMEDNVSYMEEFKKLNSQERNAINEVLKVFDEYRKSNMIPCTKCNYCVEGCPMKIMIPDIFACVNSKYIYLDDYAPYRYKRITKDKPKASDCIKCGKCERVCPQHLNIRELLENTAMEFENK